MTSRTKFKSPKTKSGCANIGAGFKRQIRELPCKVAKLVIVSQRIEDDGRIE